jgi:hypothetical protein
MRFTLLVNFSCAAIKSTSLSAIDSVYQSLGSSTFRICRSMRRTILLQKTKTTTFVIPF